jgi:hypothetical protein
MNYLQVVQVFVRTPSGQFSVGGNTNRPHFDGKMVKK